MYEKERVEKGEGNGISDFFLQGVSEMVEKKEKRWDEYEKRWREGRMEVENRGGGD